MEILGSTERAYIEVAKAAAEPHNHTAEAHRELYAMNNPHPPALLADASVITDMWLGRLTGIAGALAATAERLAAEVERERERADQAERRCAEMMALADDAIVAMADDSAAWGTRS
jgi:hypothetical protein